MTHENLAFCRSLAIAGTITATTLLIANAAQARIGPLQDQIRSADSPPPLLHRVAETGTRPGPDNFADVAEKVAPALIGVASRTSGADDRTLPGQSSEFGAPSDEDAPRKKSPIPDAPGQPKAPGKVEGTAIGSGFFVSADGYAVTNSHLVGGTDTAEVRTSDGKTYAAKVVGRDSLSDLALIKVDGRTDFAYVKLADQAPRVGDWVLSAGNTFGLGGTFTVGIVSARERAIEAASTEDFVQIDAKINKGDSGGPSFNTSGDVIGVNSMIYSPSGGSVGVAFAVPADTVKTVIPQLKDKGAVTRGSIGAEVQSVTPEIADSLGLNNVRGAIVARVQNNSPAARAGLRSGDVITSVDGEIVKNARELIKKIHVMAPGSFVQLTTLRQEKETSLNVTLSQLPDQPNRGARAPK